VIAPSLEHGLHLVHPRFTLNSAIGWKYRKECPMANPNGNPQNLRPPWKPGERVPGAGRPRKRPISEAYDELLRELLPEQERMALKLPKGTTWARAIALSRGRKALTRAGVLDAKEMREATEGRAMQRIEFGEGGSTQAEFFVVYGSAIPGTKVLDLKAELPDDAKQLPEGREADEGSSES
jgi:hypothetical protein